MRLRSCIAIEILVGATIASGLVVGGWVAGQRLRVELGSEALAATTKIPEPVRRVPTQRAPALELNLAEEPTGMFLGVSDEVLLGPLRESPITKVKFNRGGSSVSLRLDFENGSRAAFKPQQVNWQSIPRREIAAFRVNRLLGLSSVPPAIGRRFKVSDLLEKLHPDSSYFKPRLVAELTDHGGMVAGALSWWIPVIERGRVGGYELDSMEGIVTWKRFLTVGTPIPKRDHTLVRQISDMVVFDFIINNADRWSGGNARVSDDGRLLYFMDNTLSFGTSAVGHSKPRTYLQRCQKFSNSLVEHLRELDENELRRVLAADVSPFSVLLADNEISALMSRRDRALEYIDGLIRQHGAKSVLVFP